jgi:ABC-2 type transport system ATP-binding protein
MNFTATKPDGIHLPEPQPAMLIQGLTKDYTYFEKEEGLRGSLKALFARKMLTRRAVSDFTFTLGRGGIVGLMGPNGAGKTTLIKMLAGILHPTAGSARVLGFDPAHPIDAYKKQFALVMGQKSQLWWDLPAADTFLLNQAIYEIPEDTFRTNLERYAEMFAVKELLKVPVRQLSLGERMKMELIASLLHNPQVLFLDEPTIGLDDIAQRQIRELVLQVNRERGVAVLLTSHYMEDIRSLCDRVMVIRKGQKIYDGSLEALLDRYKENMTVSLRFAADTRCDWPVPPDVECVERSAFQLTARMARPRVKSYLNEALAACDVDDVQIAEEEMGDLVEKVYRYEGLHQAGGTGARGAA